MNGPVLRSPGSPCGSEPGGSEEVVPVRPTTLLILITAVTALAAGTLTACGSGADAVKVA